MKKGILLVVSKSCGLLRAASNISGVDVAEVKKLNCELLAPGSNPGRATIFSEEAVKLLDKEKLFL